MYLCKCDTEFVRVSTLLLIIKSIHSNACVSKIIQTLIITYFLYTYVIIAIKFYHRRFGSVLAVQKSNPFRCLRKLPSTRPFSSMDSPRSPTLLTELTRGVLCACHETLSAAQSLAVVSSTAEWSTPTHQWLSMNASQPVP